MQGAGKQHYAQHQDKVGGGSWCSVENDFTVLGIITARQSRLSSKPPTFSVVFQFNRSSGRTLLSSLDWRRNVRHT